MIDFLKAAVPSRRRPCLKHKRWTPFEACGRCHTVSHAFIYLKMLKRKKRKSFHLAGITGIDAQRRGETLKMEGCICCLILDFKAAIFPVLGWCLCIFFSCWECFSSEFQSFLPSSTQSPSVRTKWVLQHLGFPGEPGGSLQYLSPHPVTCEKPAHFFFKSKSNKIPN